MLKLTTGKVVTKKGPLSRIKRTSSAKPNVAPKVRSPGTLASNHVVKVVPQMSIVSRKPNFFGQYIIPSKTASNIIYSNLPLGMSLMPTNRTLRFLPSNQSLTFTQKRYYASPPDNDPDDLSSGAFLVCGLVSIGVCIDFIINPDHFVVFFASFWGFWAVVVYGIFIFILTSGTYLGLIRPLLRFLKGKMKR